MAVMLDDFIDTAFQQAHNLGYTLIVLGGGNLAHTASCASSDVEVQAGTVFAPEDGIRSQFVIAGAEFVVFLEEVQEVPGMHHGAVGAEVAVALDDPAGKKYLREFVSGNANPGIGLGILKEDIVLGPVLLNEIVLEKQGIRLGIHDGVLRIGDFGYQDPGLGREPLRRGEILGHSLVKVLGFAHIYHNPLGIIIPVDSGGMREQ